MIGYNRPGVNPVALGLLIGVDITKVNAAGSQASRNGNGSSPPPAAPSHDVQWVDLSLHDYAREEFLMRANPPDRSGDTYRIVCACADSGLSLAETRWVIDQRDDLRDRLAGRRGDDVWTCWNRCWNEFGRKQRAPAAAPLCTPAPSTNGQAPPAGGNAAPPAGGTGGSVPPPAGGGAGGGGVGAGAGVPIVFYPPPGVPMEVARRLLADHYQAQGERALLYWREDFLRWHTSHWEKVTFPDIRAAVYEILEHVSYRDAAGIVKPWAPNKSRVANVIEAMQAISTLAADLEQPSYVDGRAANVLACANGLLELDTRDLISHTPLLFNLVSVPFDCDPNAPGPIMWVAFLISLWTDDDGVTDWDSINLLQEWAGYVLSGRTDMHKILLMIGPPRCGKGTIARILEMLLGRRNCTSPTIASLTTHFGLESLIGKTLAVIGDARVGTNSNYTTLIELLLSISGEDSKSVPRKYRGDWEGYLPVRFMMLSNELPKLHDASGASATRMMILKISQSFLDKEDEELTTKLAAELPGILLWCLDGLTRLERNRKFTKPASLADAEEELMDLVSPVRAFVRDCCEISRAAEEATMDVYAAWCGWCVRNGHLPGAKSSFVRDLVAAFPKLRRLRHLVNGKRIASYAGIKLLPLSERQ